jgi:hypothetical protein
VLMLSRTLTQIASLYDERSVDDDGETEKLRVQEVGSCPKFKR